MARTPAPKFTEAQLRGFRLVESFLEVLKRVQASLPSHPTWEDPRRKTDQGQYLGLFLFALINPVVRTMRGLCQSSGFSRVQKSTGAGKCKPATFSEMQHLTDPALLEKVFAELAQELHRRFPSAPGDVSWRIVDSSVFNVMRRMDWAYFQTHKGMAQAAVRLHVSVDMISQAPVHAEVTTAKICERKVWKKKLKQGAGEIGDRNFSQDYSLLRLLNLKEGFFIVRLREKQARVDLQEELPVSQEDQEARVVRQAWAYLGHDEKTRSPRVRVIWVRMANGEELMLATNQTPEQMTAQQVSELYRHRWQVELFFRWIKCILGCRHFLAESSAGVTIQIYLALIAAVLSQMYLGQRPNKRMWEALQFYFIGLASPEELQEALQEELTKLQKKAAKKS